MDLVFQAAEVMAHVEHVRASKTFRSLYGDEPKPAIWLVGDQGVYLMSNGTAENRPPVAYAEGVNPDKNSFDTWWENKRRSFGGDDGCDPIDLEEIAKIASKNRLVCIHLRETHMEIWGVK